MRTVKPESVRGLAELWKDKTPYDLTEISQPKSQRSDSGSRPSDERRYWPVEMRYTDGVELHFVHGPDFIRFHGERGILKMRRNSFETTPPTLIKVDLMAEGVKKWQGGGHVARSHLENWLSAIRTEASLSAPVEAGHRTATICHLANISRELNRPLRWNPTTEQFIADDEANRLLERPRRSRCVLRHECS